MDQSEKIKKLRIQKGFTQKQLGEKAGISESTIRKYELGQRNPKLETLKKIALALGVSPTSLLDDKDYDFIDSLVREPFNPILSLVEEINYKIVPVGSIVREIIEEGYLWMDTPEKSFEVSQEELQKFNDKINSYIKFAIEELEKQ